MAQPNDDVFNDSAKDTTATGRDIPGGDGTVSDEDVNAIDPNHDDGKPIGQDHSLEDYEKSEPTSGVGAIQNSSDTSSDIAHIADDE
ncbi:MAG: hypothetical protein LH614_05635 [Pyrinomonadaceae bacterium]|nr:hypothetical protein [Pyrinomonadaceae bacterium]